MKPITQTLANCSWCYAHDDPPNVPLADADSADDIEFGAE